MRRDVRFTIPPAQDGVTLLAFLVQRFTYHTSERWSERIAGGRVRVNDRRTDEARVLRAGDTVVYLADDVIEPPANLDVALLYEDADILVVDKPANLPSHPGGRYFNHTLWAVLKTRWNVTEPFLVNRLDRETSGITLVARHAKAAQRCRIQFAERRVEKRYLALVEGTFPEAPLAVAGWLLPDPAVAVRKQRQFLAHPLAAGVSLATPPADTVPPTAVAEWAGTAFQRLAVHGEISLVEARPDTGRQHQIRAMLLALGYPLVGDKLYGRAPGAFERFCQQALTAEDLRLLRLPRQALHAASLRFRHPRTGHWLQLEAPLPADMAGLLAVNGGQWAVNSKQ